MDQNALQQITDRLKEANNVLVTVSTNPSVDQLSACIGITLLLNHLNKHGTAVFSGNIPSTIEFLKPDETLEKNTDSLRDFIIALDKSKADKLRYKVEDKVVKIFITPYRTSISDKDLDFSQGDFNVDVVLALGVHERADLDKAIMDHGRILHDATVISVNNKDQGNLGAINWVNLNASSLAEMLVELVHGLTTDPLDAQMATAFMTGIVAETARFSNSKTSPRTMSLASELMAAGANQQLIASKLEAGQSTPSTTDTAKAAETEDVEAADGSLSISHAETPKEEPKPETKPEPARSAIDDLFDGLANPSDAPNVTPPTPPLPSITGVTDRSAPASDLPPTGMPNRPSMALDPPQLGGQLTANSVPEDSRNDVSTDPLSLPAVDSSSNSTPPILNRPASLDGTPIQPAGLTATEEPTDAPAANAGEVLEDAREAVSEAIASEPSPHALDPIASLGAQPVDLNLRNDEPAPAPEPALPPAAPVAPALPQEPAPFNPLPPLPGEPAPDPAAAPVPVAQPNPVTPPADPFGAPPDMNGVNPNLPTDLPPSNLPPTLLPPSQPIDPTAATSDPTAPPPVPPPMMPPAQ